MKPARLPCMQGKIPLPVRLIKLFMQDKEDLKNVYNNYLQVQNLINQKAIQAPGTKKPW